MSISGKVPVCLPLTLSPRTLFCHCISSKALLRTLLRERFELLQIFKALIAVNLRKQLRRFRHHG